VIIYHQTGFLLVRKNFKNVPADFWHLSELSPASYTNQH
jgi:hypothetical protein